VDDKSARSWAVPATKWDVARVAGESTLAIREIISCILLVKLGNDQELSNQIDVLSKRADAMWALFTKMTETPDE